MYKLEEEIINYLPLLLSVNTLGMLRFCNIKQDIIDAMFLKVKNK